MLIRGDSTFSSFFLLALFQHRSSDLLMTESAVALEEQVHELPWEIETESLTELIEMAIIMEKMTPISVLQSMRCVSCQCASSLLPDQLTGNETLWKTRYETFIQHMLLPREWAIPLEGNESRLEHMILQWTGVYRVLSRDIPYLPFPTMSSIAGRNSCKSIK